MKNPTHRTNSKKKRNCSPVCHHSYGISIPNGVCISNASFNWSKSIPNENLSDKEIKNSKFSFVIPDLFQNKMSKLCKIIIERYIQRWKIPDENTLLRRLLRYTILIQMFVSFPDFAMLELHCNIYCLACGNMTYFRFLLRVTNKNTKHSIRQKNWIWT